MGVLDKCCENCHHISCLDTDNIGLCRKSGHLICRDDICNSYIPNLNGWVEITPDNVDEIDVIDPNRVVIATIIEGAVFSSVRADSNITLKSCSELGGYYYYVLPELKIE